MGDFQLPSLAALRAEVKKDFAGRFGLDALPEDSVLNILAEIIAGTVYGEYGQIAWQEKQLLPDSATGSWLDRHAAFYAHLARNPPSFASGQVKFTGSPGTQVEKDVQLKYKDTFFVTTEQATMDSSGQAVVAVKPLIPGPSGNVPAGAKLTRVSPLVGVSDAQVSTGGISGGVGGETDDALRERMIAAMQKLPQSGAGSDYVGWALKVSGVTRAWAKQDGPGKVKLTFVMDGFENIIPSALQIKEMETHILPKKPLTAYLHVYALRCKPIPFKINLQPDTEDNRKEVIAALANLLLEKGEPGATIRPSEFYGVIAKVQNLTSQLIEPAGNVVIADHEIATMGPVTWES